MIEAEMEGINDLKGDKVSSSEERKCVLKDSQFVLSGQGTTARSPQGSRFISMLEQEELSVFSGQESEEPKMSVKLPHIDACKLRDDSSYNEGIASACKVTEILLPPLRETHFTSKHKTAVSCAPFLKSSSSLPLLTNPAFKKMVNGCDFKQPRPVETLGSCFPELPIHSDGKRMSDKRELNSIHLLTKKSRQNSQALRRNSDGLRSPVRCRKSLSRVNQKDLN